MLRHPLRLGLTGGIGSGKSTVGQMLAERGAAVLDADAISRSLTAAGGAAMPAIMARFGPHIAAPDGSLDRAAMRTLVFQDATARQALEAIVHPLVGSSTEAHAQAAVAAGARLLVFDIPLLVESPRWPARLDQVLVVDCSETTQIERVMERNGLERQAVQAIIAAQASRSRRRAAADWVIYNDKLTLTQLREQAHRIADFFGL
ncbi:MAG: dephospho-CoA kinase [Acidovorax sp.]|nr:dephospho-CoA kinase [Acidovorax sp.]